MIRFLLKGLLRDRSRSLLPFFTVVLGSALTVIGYSWTNGAMSSMIDTASMISWAWRSPTARTSRRI